MRNCSHYLLATLLLISPVPEALALEKSSTNVLDKTLVKLVGEAQFSMLFWDIYHSQLFTPSGEFDDVIPGTVFEIKYQRNISQSDLIERTIEQWQHLGFSEETYQAYPPVLAALWPDITKGDKLTLVVSERSSDFYFNERFLGRVNDDSFAQIFLAIWVSPNTSQPKLRQQLIGAN